MIYTVIANKKSYDLPKKTISVMESLDKTVLIDTVKNLSLRDKFSQLLNFLIEVLGEANIKEILGSTELDEMDLSEVTLTVRKIVDAYDKPIAEYNKQKNLETLNSLPISQIEKLTSLKEIVDKSND